MWHFVDPPPWSVTYYLNHPWFLNSFLCKERAKNTVVTKPEVANQNRHVNHFFQNFTFYTWPSLFVMRSLRVQIWEDPYFYITKLDHYIYGFEIQIGIFLHFNLSELWGQPLLHFSILWLFLVLKTNKVRPFHLIPYMLRAEHFCTMD